MGIKDFWNNLTGKTAEEKKHVQEANEALQKQVEKLRAEKEDLESEKARLEAKNKSLRQAHVQGAKNAVKGGIRIGRDQMRRELSLESWEEKTKFKDLPKQEQMDKFLKHLVYDEILPQDQNKALLVLSDLMQSESVDIMRPKNRYEEDCLLEDFLQSFYDRDIGDKKDFFRKAFKVILNTKGKSSPKADLTTTKELSGKSTDPRDPLIGYFGAIKTLHPFLTTALDSAAFDMEKFDVNHFLYVYSGDYTGELEEAKKQLLLHGYDPEKDGRSKTFKKARESLTAKDLLKPKKKIDDKLQKRLNTMSARELLKTLKEGVISGEIAVKQQKARKGKGSK